MSFALLRERPRYTVPDRNAIIGRSIRIPDGVHDDVTAHFGSRHFKYMFGPLGVPELLLIFVVILIVFGPRRIPEIGKTLGKALGEFRKATDDLKNTIEREVRLEELKSIAPSIRPSFESVSRTEPAAAAPHANVVPEPDYTVDPDAKRVESES
jgi:TatA/E family protein of Tat protein translocase